MRPSLPVFSHLSKAPKWFVDSLKSCPWSPRHVYSFHPLHLELRSTPLMVTLCYAARRCRTSCSLSCDIMFFFTNGMAISPYIEPPKMRLSIYLIGIAISRYTRSTLIVDVYIYTVECIYLLRIMHDLTPFYPYRCPLFSRGLQFLAPSDACFRILSAPKGKCRIFNHHSFVRAVIFIIMNRT